MSSSSLDATHASDLYSWVTSANTSDTDFPIQNLPFGVFARGAEDPGHIGVAIGDQILDVASALDAGCFSGEAMEAATLCQGAQLNPLFAAGHLPMRALRAQVSALLSERHERIRREPALRERLLVPMSDVQMRLPAVIGDYTDFYASVYHATNVGKLFRPDAPLLPNYKYVPIGYHGRASSIVPSGTSIERPNGQSKPADATSPTFGPTRSLDYETEIGCFIGAGNALGTPISMDHAESHVAGFCLLNDWSARDVQAWEYQPLGPFLAKSFATTISPWVVTLDALEPFRIPAFARAEGDPTPLPYLASAENAQRGGIDISVDVFLASRAMRDAGISPVRVSRSRYADVYWTAAQMVTHHASNGCNLRPGDLLGSGTISGPTGDALGCLLELTQRGTNPLMLPTGEKRVFLENGDEVIMSATCSAPGARKIGFGQCRGVIYSARPCLTG